MSHFTTCIVQWLLTFAVFERTTHGRCCTSIGPLIRSTRTGLAPLFTPHRSLTHSPTQSLTHSVMYVPFLQLISIHFFDIDLCRLLRVRDSGQLTSFRNSFRNHEITTSPESVSLIIFFLLIIIVNLLIHLLVILHIISHAVRLVHLSRITQLPIEPPLALAAIISTIHCSRVRRLYY